MNLGDLDVRSVHHNRPQVQRLLTSHKSITPINVELDRDHSPSIPSSRSEPETVIRWVPPPPRLPAPQDSDETLRQVTEYGSIGVNESAHASTAPLFMLTDEERFESYEPIQSRDVGASSEERMEDDRDDPPTPNTDDTPYIRYALDQLTKPLPAVPAPRSSSGTSSTSYPIHRIIPDYGLGYVSHTREELALARKHRSSPGEGRLFNFNATRPLSYHAEPPRGQIPYKINNAAESEVFIPVDPPVLSPRYPDLMFKPTILRNFSMVTLTLLCLFMIAGVAFCAVHSTHHQGLVGWSGGIYGGLYFVFGFFPQLLAACIFIYIQCVMTAITRIMPFTLMAMDDMEQRTDALFMGMINKSNSIPRWSRPASIGVASLFFRLSIFIVPLQSCLFSATDLNGTWRWTTVEGVAWTLVAIYALIMMAALLVISFFRRRMTGLMWDPRSIADIISMLPRSNCLRDYPGTDMMTSKEQIRQRIGMRSDRLGYWRTPRHSHGIFYCLGEERATIPQYPLHSGKMLSKTYRANIYHTRDVEKGGHFNEEGARYRYIPWFLRDTYLVFWVVAGFFLLVAVIVVSFLPSTAIRHGFSPLMSAVSDAGGFSPANFLFSFIPSILGMLLYLLFQPLDMAIRQYQPWAKLQHPEGATAEESLLLDYTASLPVECTFKALGGRHYRVAILSTLSLLFILLPVLAGGLFFPLTTPENGVRMIPNLPSFYVILTLLVLYFLGLLLVIPNRDRMHLPHAIDCIAEVVSFVYDSSILDNGAFRTARSKPDLVTKLLATRATGHQMRFGFGTFRGRLGQECIGIEKVSRMGAREVMVFDGR